MTIVTNPQRDAHATFAGFVYQVNVSILRWLDLLPGQYLELEAGEDVDLIQKGAGADQAERHRLMEQLKHKKRALTLRSDDALEAIANFCEHRKANPGANLQFRFLTTAYVAKERAPWLGDPNVTVVAHTVQFRRLQFPAAVLESLSDGFQPPFANSYAALKSLPPFNVPSCAALGHLKG